MTKLTDAEITYLSFVADALVHRPDRHALIFARAASSMVGSGASDEYRALMRALERAFDAVAVATAEDAISILKQGSEQDRRAATVLAWGRQA